MPGTCRPGKRHHKPRVLDCFRIVRLAGGDEPPGRPHLLAFEAPNLLITSHPMVMVPTFAVPLVLMLHGVVLWRLRRESASNGRLAAA